MTIDASIRQLLEWANEKVAGQQEPPWARPHYEQLLETLIAIQRGRKATISLEDSRQLAVHSGDDRPLAENIHSLETARLRRGIAEIPMPM